ncbi:MAG: CotH kinase family protein [Pseudomonadota bacterium]|nr:CotH kinase family protein [Pseudomonadota bacterium]
MSLLWMLIVGCESGPDTGDVSGDAVRGVESAGDAPRPRFLGAQPHPEAALKPYEDGAPGPDEDPALSEFLWEEGSIHDFRLTLSPSDMALLEADPGTDVAGTLAYRDHSWSVGVRLKGNRTLRTFAEKPSLKIDVHEWRPNQRFFGLRRLTLNNMVQDKSMVKEHISYHLYRTLGVPAPRHGYVRLTINARTYGLYGLVQSMDQQFIDRHWNKDDEGNLYEGGYGADLHHGHGAFALQEAGVPEAPADIEALIDALEESTPDTLLAVLEDRFDLDTLLTALAIDLVSGNWDAYARAANNYLLYHAPEADRWHFIPWGQDQAFTDVNVPLDAGWQGELLERCGDTPACRARLYARVEDVLAAWMQADLLGYAERTTEALAADCQGDVRAEIPCSTGDVLEFLATRPGKVREELDAP